MNTIVLLVLVLIVIAIICIAFLGALSSRRTGSMPLRPKPMSLTEAETLFGQQQYQLSVIKAFSAIETSLKTVAQDRKIQVGTNTAFDYLQAFVDRKILSPETASKAHQVRMLRNRAIHESQGVGRTQAEQLLVQTKSVLKALHYQVD